ncbi:interleukin-15-like [Chaetodon trifascialis]|uniref:interleukin-15-like n=1 Tax=Chaetodon trifascialis TaxID=109706 RepID=UPI0039949D24
MTDFMTAPPLILVQPTCPRDPRTNGVQLQSTCNLCRESLKTQVWLCFLVLSFVSTFACAASVPGTADVQTCLDELKSAIQKSDAMLYAPSVNDVEEKCKVMSLRCYMLELIMVLDEEEIFDNNADCLMDFNDELPPEANSVGCPPCEAYSLKNITTFLERLESLLQEMTSANT